MNIKFAIAAAQNEVGCDVSCDIDGRYIGDSSYSPSGCIVFAFIPRTITNMGQTFPPVAV